jgi:hypothetical protein
LRFHSIGKQSEFQAEWFSKSKRKHDPGRIAFAQGRLDWLDSRKHIPDEKEIGNAVDINTTLG